MGKTPQADREKSEYLIPYFRHHFAVTLASSGDVARDIKQHFKTGEVKT